MSTANQKIMSRLGKIEENARKALSIPFKPQNIEKLDAIPKLQYRCQSVGEELERPDMVGYNTQGEEVFLCEMKFYAGLTPNQPLGYLTRIQRNHGQGLIFLCPSQRKTSLWTKLMSLCENRSVEHLTDSYAEIDHIPMGILSWDTVIQALDRVVPDEFRADLKQLQGFCEHMDKTAFLPFSSEDLSYESARKAIRPYDILDEVVSLMLRDHQITSAGKSSGRTHYERKLTCDGVSFSLLYDIQLWKSNESVETPFWFGSYEVNCDFCSIPKEMKDNSVWSLTYLALIPPVDAPFEDVCQSLKEQIYEYIDLYLAHELK